MQKNNPQPIFWLLHLNKNISERFTVTHTFCINITKPFKKHALYLKDIWTLNVPSSRKARRAAHIDIIVSYASVSSPYFDNRTNDHMTLDVGQNAFFVTNRHYVVPLVIQHSTATDWRLTYTHREKCSVFNWHLIDRKMDTC